MLSNEKGYNDLVERREVPGNPRVLVAVVNSLRDFEIARDQRWYRIPIERAPSQVGADYLAFYQTKVFGEERWAVNYYASIKRYRIVSRRALLPEEPDHPRADDLYYKIGIGRLERLSRPIPSHRLRRITFIPTTLRHLLRAEEINDLWCGGAAEERLWKAFKENGLTAERCYPLKEEDEGYHIDFALFCNEGKIAVLLEGETTIENVHVMRERPRTEEYNLKAGGWTPLPFTGRQIGRSLPGCLDAIMAAVAQHGGFLPH